MNPDWSKPEQDAAVDPLLIQAREIAARTRQSNHAKRYPDTQDSFAVRIANGEWDDHMLVIAALEGLRSVREPALAEAARVVLAEFDRRDAKGGELFDLLEDWANPPAPVDPLVEAMQEATGQGDMDERDADALREALAKRGLTIVAQERGE